MGRKEASTGLKRKPAPRFWPIHRKEFLWVVKPSPGPHSLEGCLPLAIVLRDILKFARTRKEAKIIVSQGKVHVDGKVRRKDNFPVGLMDVISFPQINKCFRVLPSSKGLIFHQINEKESNFKLCRITRKKIIENGQIQLSLHDGSNVLVKVADTESSEEATYKTLDTVKISLPERQILKRIKMKEKCFAVITCGKNIGKRGTIIKIEKIKGKKRRNALVTIKDKKERYQTILSCIFTVGEERPLISMPEAVQLA